MPFLLPLVPVIAGGLASAAAGGGFIGAIAGAVVAVGAGALVSKLGPKQGDETIEQQAAGRNLTIRSSTEPRRIILGESGLVGGLLSYAEVIGTGPWEDSFLWLVLTYSGHQVASIDAISFDDELIAPSQIDGSGNVTGGTFQGSARIFKYLGTPTDAAEGLLLTDTEGGWTSNHRQRGCAKLYVRLYNSDTVFPGGMPNIKASFRGAACFDPRDGATRYTVNPALILRWYLMQSFGLSASAGEIPDSDVIVAANLSDERVSVPSHTSSAITLSPSTNLFTFAQPENRIGTGDAVQIITTGSLSGTGLATGTTYYAIRQPHGNAFATTYANAIAGNIVDLSGAGTGTHQLVHLNQARYTCNGEFTLDQGPRRIIEIILASMAGTLVYAQGVYRIFAGAYSTPVVTLTASDLRGEIEYTPRPSREDLFNVLRVKYFDTFLNNQLTDAPEVSSAQYITDDGGQRLPRDMELTLVNNVMRAQRIARVTLNRARAPRLRMPCKLTALQVALWDNVMVTIPQLGLSAAVFRVIGWELVASAEDIGVNLDLQADSAADWGWAVSDGSFLAPQGPLNVPTPFVPPPTNVAANSGTAHLLRNGDGTILSRILVTWTQPSSPNVHGFEIGWKVTTDTDFSTSTVPTETPSYYIVGVRDGSQYNIQVRSIGPGVGRSDWVGITHTVIGKSAPPTAPTSLSAHGISSGIALVWSQCPDVDYSHTQVWEAASNDRALSARVDGPSADRGNLSASGMSRTGLVPGTTRWYWVRHVDTSGNVSTYFPVSATAGVSATATWINEADQVEFPNGMQIRSGTIDHTLGAWSGVGWLVRNEDGNTIFGLRDINGNLLEFDGTDLTTEGDWAGGGGTPTPELDIDVVRNLSGSSSASVVSWSYSAVVHRNSILESLPKVTNGGGNTSIATAGPVSNGRDQAAAFVANDNIHFYALINNAGTSFGTVCSKNHPFAGPGGGGPTLPTGFNKWAYAFSVRLDASAQIPLLLLAGNRIYFVGDPLVRTPILANVTAAGGAPVSIQHTLMLPNTTPRQYGVSARGLLTFNGVLGTELVLSSGATLTSGSGRRMPIKGWVNNSQAIAWGEFEFPVGGSLFAYWDSVTASPSGDVWLSWYSVSNGG